MPITKDNGQPGLLATGRFGEESKRVPLYKQVKDVNDPRLLAALFRDYTFWASSYLLEPCNLNLLSRGEYGLGRDRLPENIAVPLNIIANKLGMKPFMELYNWKKKDPKKGVVFDNLELIRKFTGMPSESGFILVHVAMVAHTPKLVRATLSTLEAVEKGERKAFNNGMRQFLSPMKAINLEMDSMWSRSNPDDYKEFRTFIMGTKNQPMFPNGVIYEGVSEEPLYYRGESGANDSIIPTADNLLQVYQQMPDNPLTEILKDFRTYRPLLHNKWLEMIQHRSNRANLRNYAMGDVRSAVLYLAILDQIREFRQRHWNFTKEYIIKHTNHPVATGGSPIITWLPNQLSTVLTVMEETASKIKSSSKVFKSILRKMTSQKSILQREVENLKKQARAP